MYILEVHSKINKFGINREFPTQNKLQIEFIKSLIRSLMIFNGLKEELCMKYDIINKKMIFIITWLLFIQYIPISCDVQSNMNPIITKIQKVIGDIDEDGQIDSMELNKIKQGLHRLFDTDDSGNIDTIEIKKLVPDPHDIEAAFSKLDADRDEVISLKELDKRWEHIGSEMTVEEVVEWVQYSVQLPQYAELFRQHAISGYTFPLLMANDGNLFQEIGIDSKLHQQQLAMFMKRKYLGAGAHPPPVSSTSCNMELEYESDSILVHVQWDNPQQESDEMHTTLLFQLQRRRPREPSWTTIFVGHDLEYLDLFEIHHKQPSRLSKTSLPHILYRVTTWNSYGRSSHVIFRCGESSKFKESQAQLIGVSQIDPSNDRNSDCSVNPKHELPFPIPHSDKESHGLLIHSGQKNNQKAGTNVIRISSEEISQQTDHKGKRGLKHIWSHILEYFWWWDEAIAIALFIIIPIRGLLYGDANYFRKLFRRLPPSIPTRVLVVPYVPTPSKIKMLNNSKLSHPKDEIRSRELPKYASVTVSWERPQDNGVQIVCYCVKWIRTKSEEMKWIKLLNAFPLPTSVTIDSLEYGETYKFFVEATNAYGLTSRSSRSTYMVPVPELKHRQFISSRSMNEAKVLRNQCHICAAQSHDSHRSIKPVVSSNALQHLQNENSHETTNQIPVKRGTSIFSTSSLDRRILHFCSQCDLEFCHYHKGNVRHTKALSCPAVGGRCVCLVCFEKSQPK